MTLITSRLAHRRYLAPFGVVLLACLATASTLYLHEWGHAAGWVLIGYQPCVGFNNSWANEPFSDILAVVPGLGGPVMTLTIGLGFGAVHLWWRRAKLLTFTIAVSSLVGHFLSTLLFILDLALYGSPSFFDDAATVGVLLPMLQETVEILNLEAAALGRSFLVRPEALLTVWPFASLPLALIAVLTWRGGPFGMAKPFVLVLVVGTAVIWTVLVHPTLGSSFGFYCPGWL